MKYTLLAFILALAIPCDGLCAEAAPAGERHLLVTFPWSTANIGDIAITPGLLSLIQETHPGLPTVERFWTTEQAYSLYQRAETVVSMEMHSVIMALSLGTPVLMPQFSENGRKVWMLEELGLADWIFDIDDPQSSGELLTAALRTDQAPAAAQQRVRSQLPRLRQLGVSVIREVEMGWRK